MQSSLFMDNNNAPNFINDLTADDYDEDEDDNDFNELANQGKLRPSLTAVRPTQLFQQQQVPQEQPVQGQEQPVQGHGFDDDDDDDESQSSHGSVISNESEKLDLLVQLDQLRSRGHIVRDFDLRSNVIDMKKEEHRVKRSLQLTSSLKFQQKMLMAIVSGLEYANKRFDPFSIDLDGWSENIFENIEDFNTMFERLFEKYCKKGEMAPALEFMIRLAGSAFMFNMSNQLFKNIKGPSLKNLRQTVCNAMSQQAAPLHAHNFQVHDLQTQQMPPPNQQVHHVPPPPPP